MYLCLNRMTVKGGLSDAEFLDVARDAGYDGADVPMHLAMTQPAAAIADAPARLPPLVLSVM